MKPCNQCGKCCIKYADGGLNATREEIAMWELFNPEIYEYVKNNEIWFDPQTRQQLTQCPFLLIEESTSVQSKQLVEQAPLKYTCSIYQDRPEDCRHYPSLITEMIADECEMIEVVDLENYQKAQNKLDLIMQDSRPSKG